MKHLLTLIGILWTSCLFAQTGNCDSIIWSKDRKLSWSDFKAKPDTALKDTAQSFIRLHKKWSLRGDTVTINVSSYFRPCLAWTKTKNADTLLMHEQGHFDISEYFRRLSIKRFSEQNFTRPNLKREIEAINLDIESQQKQLIDLYEVKTGNSRNRAVQVEWTNKILSLIDSLKEFDQPKITKLLTE
ncbi:MAG: hypothetical protein ABI741_07845 [Ferruginibacter sp.]